jgi:phage terminase large subunit
VPGEGRSFSRTSQAIAQLAPEEREHFRAILRDPVRYARHILRHDVWPTSAAILYSVRDHPRTAVKACHASSKTFTAAEAVLWWFTLYPDGIVITTAPTWTQVARLLWGEVRKAATTGRITFPRLYATELRDPDNPDNFAIGLSTNEGVRFQGFHGRVLVVFDEAPGVRLDIWDAVEGVRAGGDVRWLVLGNPVEAGGPFHDIFTGDRGRWQTFTIDGLDSPNTWSLGPTPEARLEVIRRAFAEQGPDHPLLAENVRPYLITRGYIAEKLDEWGEEDPRFQARVRGQFPDNSEYAVFALSWLERSQRALLRPGLLGPLRAGVDVAGPGEDETVCYVMDASRQVMGMKAWTHRDPRGDLIAFLNGFGGPGRFDAVNVDVIGIGYYFAQAVRDARYPVQEVNVGNTPTEAPPRSRPEDDPRERFLNLKAEVYWKARDILQAGPVPGLTDQATIGQLSTVRWSTNSRGKIVIESKEAMRDRGVRSPDRAEAFILAMIPPPAPHRVAVRAPSVSLRHGGNPAVSTGRR